jgi:hypothetical protein
VGGGAYCRLTSGQQNRSRSKDTFPRLILNVGEETGIFENVSGEESAVKSAVLDKAPAPFVTILLMMKAKQVVSFCGGRRPAFATVNVALVYASHMTLPIENALPGSTSGSSLGERPAGGWYDTSVPDGTSSLHSGGPALVGFQVRACRRAKNVDGFSESAVTIAPSASSAVA